MKSVIWIIILTLAGITQGLAQLTALDDYIAKPDPNYEWNVYDTDNDVLVETYFIRLVSQQWRTAAEVDRPVWEHELIVSVPNFFLCGSTNNSTESAILLVADGFNPAPGAFTTQVNELVSNTAFSLCSVTALLRQVPNQPLNFTDEVNRPRVEDAIIAYSFDKYLETGDPEWPALLPMTKAAVRAMDAVQEFSRNQSGVPNIDDFIVIGASKRGWTTWLTAAADSRVKMIIPISFDFLNIDEQFIHQVESYGDYVPVFSDYTDFNLPCRYAEPAGQELLNIVDPYAYLTRFNMPKIIINSAGDQFFVTDSWRFYYDQLPPQKYLRYTPNTGHGQGFTEANEAALVQLFFNLRSSIDNINDGEPLPNFSWSFEADGSIRVQTLSTPLQVRLWQASNPDMRDFRRDTIGAVWTSSNLSDTGGGVYIGSVTPPVQGYKAFFVELEFEESAFAEANQIFTTGVRVIPDTLPFAGVACPLIFQDQFEQLVLRRR
jgi:PhoPQ-activated pathogenicity-related protein